MPDALFDDDAVIERRVLGNDVEIALYNELVAERIPDERWRSADALIVYYGVPIDRALIARLDTCRIVARAGVGYDHIDLAACGERGIPVCNVPDYGTTEVADHAIALMLGLARGLVSYHARLLADPHAGWHWAGAPLVRRLRGSRFGVVGLGRIGTAAARRARGLDMEVSFYDPHLPDGADLAHGHRRVASLESLLTESDVVSLHCPLVEETRHMIDDEAVAAMKPGSLLINTARGGLVDLGALERGMRKGTIAGAGLDVLPAEARRPASPDSAHRLVLARRPRRSTAQVGRGRARVPTAWAPAQLRQSGRPRRVRAAGAGSDAVAASTPPISPSVSSVTRRA
jgi:phosphoglycerate dehydrogenase-like enzyme